MVGMAVTWARMLILQRVAKQMLVSFEQKRAAAILSSNDPGNQNSTSGSLVSLMTDLKKVYRFKDVRQVSLLCREMRRWDEDGIPDQEASKFGEFVIKVTTFCTGDSDCMQHQGSGAAVHQKHRNTTRLSPTLELFEGHSPDMLTRQNGVCAACGAVWHGSHA